MNAAIITTSPPARRIAPLLRPEAQRLVDLGQDRGWQFAILGLAPCPEQPVRSGDWLIVPAHQDSSRIPARTLERVQAIYEAGLRPKAFMLVHEAPLQLAAPNAGEAGTQPWISPELQSRLAKGTLLGLGLGVAALAVAAVLPLVLLAGAAASIDPILVAVTDDDVWIEVDRWDI